MNRNVPAAPPGKPWLDRGHPIDVIPAAEAEPVDGSPFDASEEDPPAPADDAERWDGLA